MKWTPVLLSFLILSSSCGQPDPRPDAARPVVQFTDIAPSAGITFRHTNGKSGRYYFLETVAS